MKFIKKCSNLLNRVATLVKSTMPWRRGEYNFQLPGQELQTSDGEVKLLSHIILDDCGASARRAFTGRESTAHCNSGESTKWSEKHPPKDSNLSWEETVNIGRTEKHSNGMIETHF